MTEFETKYQHYKEIKKHKRKMFWKKTWQVTKVTLNTISKITITISKVMMNISQAIFESFGENENKKPRKKNVKKK